MKRYFRLGLGMTMFISSLLFLDKGIAIVLAVFLIGYLELEDIRFSFLPLILIPLWQDSYGLVLFIVYLIMIIPFFKVKHNRYYILLKIIITLVILNIALYALNLYTLNILYYSLLVFVFYGLINVCFYISKDSIIVSLNERLPLLIIILLYLVVFVINKVDSRLILFLFMQLYLINDYKYNLILTFIYALLFFIINKNINLEQLSVFSSSYMPLISLLYFDYSNYMTILYIIYTVILMFSLEVNKKAKVETNYINHLFRDFKEYLTNIGFEDERLDIQDKVRQKHLEDIQYSYCNNCRKTTLCKNKLDLRYQFLLSASRGEVNIYNCPYYDMFKLDDIPPTSVKIREQSGVRNLVDELEYVYSQSLNFSEYYNNFLSSLEFYGYHPIDIDIYFASISIYFRIKLSKKKKIAKELLSRLASKTFKEKITLKVIEFEEYYYVYFYKTPKCHIEYSHTVLAKNSNIVSGDNYYIKKDYNDSYIFALSDGMGSGHNAYLESSRTLELIKSLAVSHFSIKTSLKLLEDIEGLRSDYDSYATLDLLFLNPSLMKANLYKLGSSVSYLYHNHELISYQNRALPLKLDDINSAYEIELVIGDILILLSDGVSDFISLEQLQEVIDETLPTNIILERIINKIKENVSNVLKDDLSLIIIKLIN